MIERKSTMDARFEPTEEQCVLIAEAHRDHVPIIMLGRGRYVMDVRFNKWPLGDSEGRKVTAHLELYPMRPQKNSPHIRAFFADEVPEDIAERMANAGANPKCYFCGTGEVGRDDFCPGCKTFICEECDLSGAFIGHSNPKDHLDD